MVIKSIAPVAFVLLFLFCQQSFAQTPATAAALSTPATVADKKEETPESALKLDDLKALDYPELQVVPRASERLALEAGAVRDRGVLLLFPYVASSVMSLSSGLIVNSGLKPDLDAEERSRTVTNSKLAIGVGAVGLGMVYWYTYADHYGSALAQIRGFKNRDRRTELLKERLAEEAFEKSANLITQWKWIFAITNMVASVQLTGKTTGDTNVIPNFSVAAAFLPLLITTGYESNYSKQQEYKRRIYVPLTWFDYGYNPEFAGWQPQLNAVWTF